VAWERIGQIGYVSPMLTWIPAAVCAVFLVLTGRTWMDFTHRQEQLAAAIREQGRLIEEHTTQLEQIRQRSQAVKEVADACTLECNELEEQIRELHTQLKTLEERLERLRPSDRQVDKDRSGDEWLWKK
jgi:septal ring factor EnvC (AmiA/AmiB activator)